MDEDEGEDEGPPSITSVKYIVPPELGGGVYANTVTVFHSGYEFTLDWAVTQVAEQGDPSDPESALVIPWQVTSRVRIPVAIVFDVLRAINDEMTRYEKEWGEIRPVTPRAEEEGQEPN